MNPLDQPINLPETIFTSLKKAIEVHFALKEQAVDADQCARLIGGMLLGHIILPEKTPF